ncbi:MAG: peptidoglycan DD-metalloendopeptidase family protein [Candidatus Bathyarchaeia archaeon]
MSIEFHLFHDYHGDGVKQQDEPSISDAVIDVRDENNQDVLTGITCDRNGVYKINDLKEGKYRLMFSTAVRAKYRYISVSNDRFYHVDYGYEFIANPTKTRFDIGLMNGYLTLPFEEGVKCPIFNYFDRGGGKGWNGRPATRYHGGVDFSVPMGTKVLAPAPGKIVAAEDGWPLNFATKYPRPGSFETGNYVIIDLDNNVRVMFKDLGRLLIQPVRFGKQPSYRVKRGEVIALSGDTGLNNYRRVPPHVHLEIYPPRSDWTPYYAHPLEFSFRDYFKYCSDPFDDTNSAWTKDNDPQYPKAE